MSELLTFPDRATRNRDPASGDCPAFCVIFRPNNQPAPSHWVLFFPSLAEEMNKSRKLVADQAQALAAKGYGVLLIDYPGTGDSGGELQEVDWSFWSRQILEIIDWLKQQGAESLSLWALRVGALLALEVLSGPVSIPVNKLVLWQPVLNGKLWLNQFLRLGIAAGISGSQDLSRPTSTSELRQQLAAGEVVEVAGYPLNQSLAAGLETPHVPPDNPTLDIDWFDVHPSASAILPASQKVIEQWVSQGCNVIAHLIQGSSFWSTQEIADVPSLVNATSDVFPSLSQVPLATRRSVQVFQGAKPVDGTELHEQALAFDCEGHQLLGILHKPQHSQEQKIHGIVMIIGGPQYRVGSHRLYLQWARQLAQAGFAVLRFDYRGMGDSEGHFVGFEGIQDDIHAAINTLVSSQPGIEEITLWGLCDGATAAGFYAQSDPRVRHLVLLNPWVRSEQSQAKTYIKHYYWHRLRQKDFWKKLLSGKLAVLNSVSALGQSVHRSLKPDASATSGNAALPQRLGDGLGEFSGNLLLLLSGNDLTASEFTEATHSEPRLQRALSQPTTQLTEFAAADHTFSRASWKQEVVACAIQWLRQDT